MCGRYATTRTAADLTALFEALDVSGGTIAVDYNVAPTDPVPVDPHVGQSAAGASSTWRAGALSRPGQPIGGSGRA